MFRPNVCLHVPLRPGDPEIPLYQGGTSQVPTQRYADRQEIQLWSGLLPLKGQYNLTATTTTAPD